MILQIVETVKVNGRWFIEPLQYAIHSVDPGDKDCNEKRYIVEIDGVYYRIPARCVALMPGDTPSTDTRNQHQRTVEQIIIDPIPGILGKNDAVAAAKKFLGVDIAAKKSMDQADYDGYGKKLLEQALDEAREKDQDGKYRESDNSEMERPDAV